MNKPFRCLSGSCQIPSHARLPQVGNCQPNRPFANCWPASKVACSKTTITLRYTSLRRQGHCNWSHTFAPEGFAPVETCTCPGGHHSVDSRWSCCLQLFLLQLGGRRFSDGSVESLWLVQWKTEIGPYCKACDDWCKLQYQICMTFPCHDPVMATKLGWSACFYSQSKDTPCLHLLLE
jgi:hypothetical protein